MISPANAEATHFIETWPQESSTAALIYGSEGSGKTHLALNWVKRVGGVILDKNLLGTLDSLSLWQGASHAVLEDIQMITNEQALFHLLRQAESTGFFLLCTARDNASNLLFRLPDLRSRLLALPQVAIHEPDEELLRVFLYKCFSDRQLRVNEEIIKYILKRMERSFVSAIKLVEHIENESFISKREITIPFLKSLIV